MGKTYHKKVGDRFFNVKKDYFGNWSIYSAHDDFSPMVGVPPFSVGHRTKAQAMEFLESFYEE